MFVHTVSFDRPEGLIGAYRRLRGARDVASLFADGALLAVDAAGFDRAIVASVVDGTIMGRDLGVIPHRGSDRLRRRLLSSPVPLRPGTAEAEAIRRPDRRGRRPLRSDLAEALGLHHWCVAAVAPEGAALALLVVDRSEGPIQRDDITRVEHLAAAVGVALERTILRSRVSELAEEVKQFAGLADALAREVRDAPLTLRTTGLPTSMSEAGVAPDTEALRALLTPQERRVAALLVEGRSNPDIAQALVLSRETVKTHVAHILRKVGAANRVEAAFRLAPLLPRAA